MSCPALWIPWRVDAGRRSVSKQACCTLWQLRMLTNLSQNKWGFLPGKVCHYSKRWTYGSNYGSHNLNIDHRFWNIRMGAIEGVQLAVWLHQAIYFKLYGHDLVCPRSTCCFLLVGVFVPTEMLWINGLPMTWLLGLGFTVWTFELPKLLE